MVKGRESCSSTVAAGKLKDKMSSRKGNHKKKGQKHQNISAYKNDKYGAGRTVQALNSMTVSNVCQRCKNKIEWRIKFNKYTPLSAPRKCVRCFQKSVKYAYHVACTKCAVEQGVCAKCLENKEIVEPPTEDPSQVQREKSILREGLKSMSLRERRTFLRQIEKDSAQGSSQSSSQIEDHLDNETVDRSGMGDYFVGEGIRQPVGDNDGINGSDDRDDDRNEDSQSSFGELKDSIILSDHIQTMNSDE